MRLISCASSSWLQAFAPAAGGGECTGESGCSSGNAGGNAWSKGAAAAGSFSGIHSGSAPIPTMSYNTLSVSSSSRCARSNQPEGVQRLPLRNELWHVWCPCRCCHCCWWWHCQRSGSRDPLIDIAKLRTSFIREGSLSTKLDWSMIGAILRTTSLPPLRRLIYSKLWLIASTSRSPATVDQQSLQLGLQHLPPFWAGPIRMPRLRKTSSKVAPEKIRILVIKLSLALWI